MTPPHKRKPENKGLPKRWTLAHGAYYYYVPKGLEHLWDNKKMFRLGKTLPEAYRVWTDRIEAQANVKKIKDLLDRYLIEVVPGKAPRTQEENRKAMPRLRSVFGEMGLNAVKPRHVYQYVEKRKARTSSHREIAVLSHALTKAVEWGYIDRHPFKGEIRLVGEKPRTRYVEDWEILECLNLPANRQKGSVLVIQAYIKIKLMTGMARSDLLRLSQSDLKDDGIHIQRHKTRKSSGKRTIYEWTPELKEAVEFAKSIRPIAISPFLFCNREGHCYINEETGKASGWDSMWQRFITRVLRETNITERFTEHDLRAKCASDAESLEQARGLLSHADAKTTESIYRRKPERVKPLKGVGKV